MAGLSHNPKASYCTKWLPGEPTDPDAVCDYCQARGLGPQPIVEDDKPVTTGELKVGMEEVMAAEQGKPLIVQFFERIGIVKGSVIEQVRTVDGHYLGGPFTIVDLAGYEDKEIVLSLREPGLRAVHRVVWSKIASYVV